MSRLGRAVEAGRGWAGRGLARHGEAVCARKGSARRGVSGLAKAVQAGSGESWLGGARQGRVRRSMSSVLRSGHVARTPTQQGHKPRNNRRPYNG